MVRGSILIIEDNQDIAELLTMYLERHGYRCIVHDGWDSLAVLRRENIDCILLDVMLTGTNGFELCPEIRKLSDVPILFLSAKADVENKVLGLELGADDFIPKPFNPNEVVARVEAHLRRYRSLRSTEAEKTQIFRVADLEIDEESFTVCCGENTIYLSAKEFQLLKILAQNADRVYRPEELYEIVWRSNSVGDVRTVMVHISNLRKKIEVDPARPKYIVTIRGIGYQFAAQARSVV